MNDKNRTNLNVVKPSKDTKDGESNVKYIKDCLELPTTIHNFINLQLNEITETLRNDYINYRLGNNKGKNEEIKESVNKDFDLIEKNARASSLLIFYQIFKDGAVEEHDILNKIYSCKEMSMYKHDEPTENLYFSGSNQLHGYFDCLQILEAATCSKIFAEIGYYNASFSSMNTAFYLLGLYNFMSSLDIDKAYKKLNSNRNKQLTQSNRANYISMAEKKAFAELIDESVNNKDMNCNTNSNKLPSKKNELAKHAIDKGIVNFSLNADYIIEKHNERQKKYTTYSEVLSNLNFTSSNLEKTSTDIEELVNQTMKDLNRLTEEEQIKYLNEVGLKTEKLRDRLHQLGLKIQELLLQKIELEQFLYLNSENEISINPKYALSEFDFWSLSLETSDSKRREQLVILSKIKEYSSFKDILFEHKNYRKNELIVLKRRFHNGGLSFILEGTMKNNL